MPRELLDNNTRFIPGDGDPFAVATEIRRKAEAVVRQAGVL